MESPNHAVGQLQIHTEAKRHHQNSWRLPFSATHPRLSSSSRSQSSSAQLHHETRMAVRKQKVMLKSFNGFEGAGLTNGVWRCWRFVLVFSLWDWSPSNNWGDYFIHLLHAYSRIMCLRHHLWPDPGVSIVIHEETFHLTKGSPFDYSGLTRRRAPIRIHPAHLYQSQTIIRRNPQTKVRSTGGLTWWNLSSGTPASLKGWRFLDFI